MLMQLLLRDLKRNISAAQIEHVDLYSHIHSLMTANFSDYSHFHEGRFV